ncbi:MAG: ABC transporter permease, partial [Tannerella sp.]|nr:ABC transporter permease [Tannerella sp.]
MRPDDIIRKNIKFYLRYYKLVATAVLIAAAVITGSLATGDSVRTTLVKRVEERLGDTETVLFSRNSFMDEALLHAPLFDGRARGILLTDGFVAQNGKLIPVHVWGTDDMSIPDGGAGINPSLARELAADGDIVLRLPSTGLVPSGSLFVTESYTTSLRLSTARTVGGREGGNISLRNEQVIPLNIFVSRRELAETLDLNGKINLILADRKITDEAFEKYWNHSYSGLHLRRDDGFTEITSDRIFLQEDVVKTVAGNNPETNRMFSYLANALESDGASIPYSFVTAADRYRDEPLRDDEIILSDYAAERLRSGAGDTVSLAYFTSHDLKTLATDTIRLRVKKIVPVEELAGDKTLSADFPGLSDVEKCTDWDSDLPVDMNLITGEDEKYWESYRATPKAIIAYNAVAGDWSNAYGNATALRVGCSRAPHDGGEPRADGLHEAGACSPDLSGLTSRMFGIQLAHPRDAGIYAARNGVDFSGLFLALGFFIIVSAMLLMLAPLSEMLYRRQDEINLLQALGYTRKKIAGMLWRESAPVVFASSVAGVIAGLLYTTAVMWLLGSVWKGATHTGGFSVYPGVAPVVSGFIAGVALSLLLLRMATVRSLKEKPPVRSREKISLRTKKNGVILSSVLTVATVCANLLFFHSVILFVLSGILITGTAAVWGDCIVCRKGGSPTDGGFSSEKIIWRTLFASGKQSALSFFTLTTGVFIVFSTGLNRKSFADSARLRTGTGGYSLWCESSVPIYHSMATKAGREKLSLAGLPPDAKVIQCLRHGADDASCLNLNKVSSPTVLGLDMEDLLSSDFETVQSLHSLTRDGVFRQMRTAASGPVYPALVDETVLTWGLMMKTGDTLHYENDRGETVALRLIGALSNSIFQGNILVDREAFRKIWPETTGSEVFLVKVGEAERESTKTLLSQALGEYGVRITATNERLREFNSVTDTYLTIFMTLGGLGLLLGIMSFIIVVRKNLVARRREIRLYRTLGFTDEKTGQILYRENVAVPLYAIA